MCLESVRWIKVCCWPGYLNRVWQKNHFESFPFFDNFKHSDFYAGPNGQTWQIIYTRKTSEDLVSICLRLLSFAFVNLIVVVCSNSHKKPLFAFTMSRFSSKNHCSITFQLFKWFILILTRTLIRSSSQWWMLNSKHQSLFSAPTHCAEILL